MFFSYEVKHNNWMVLRLHWTEKTSLSHFFSILCWLISVSVTHWDLKCFSLSLLLNFIKCFSSRCFCEAEEGDGPRYWGPNANMHLDQILTELPYSDKYIFSCAPGCMDLLAYFPSTPHPNASGILLGRQSASDLIGHRIKERIHSSRLIFSLR